MSSVSAARVVRRGLAVCAAVLALPSAAFAAPDDCSPLSLKTCLAPFPSNYWATPDASSPTGVRGNVADDVLRPELLAQLPVADGISPSGIFNGATGFSAGAGAVFEFGERQAPPPSDGGDVVTAYDLDAGEEIPVHAFLSRAARNPSLVGDKQSNVLQVFPRTRWPYTHRVLVAVSTAMGQSDPAFPALAAKWKPGTRQGDYVATVAAALKQAGLDPAATRTATVFTVRDRAEVVNATQRLMDDTSSRPHPVRDVRMNWNLATPLTLGVVTGWVRLDNYRTRDGRGPVDFSGATRKDQWVPFQLTLPRSAGTRPAPVVIYAHGITIQKESDVIVSQMNAQLGLATISIDWPNHGERSRADGGYLLDLLDASKLGTLSGLFNQATVDLTGLYRAIGGMQLDVVRRPTWNNPFGRGGDGRPDLRTSSISMQGTSLGGVLGGNFAAMSPKLDFIDFHVTGLNLSHIISQTVLWDVFGNVLPKGRTGTEDAVLQAALQQVIDPSDGINTIDFVRHPRPGQAKKPMFVMTGDGDAIVPNSASVAVANLVDLPLTGPQRYAMPGVRTAEQADPDGYEIRQYPAFLGATPWLPLFGESTAHIAFVWPAAYDAQARFIKRFGPTP